MTIVTDVAHALKALRRDRGPTMLVILILALGIGVTASVYSVTAGVLLRPLPFPDADRLVRIQQVDPAKGWVYDASGPSIRDWQAASRSLGAIGASTGAGEVILGGPGQPVRVRRASVTAGFFDVLGMEPVLGRFPTPSEAETGAAVAVVSYGLWRERLGGEPGALGGVLTVDGTPYEVVGVAPATLDLPRGARLWTPLAPDAELWDVRYAHILPTVARLAPGATAVSAQEELNAILARVPGYEVQARVTGLKESLVGDYRRPLLVLLGGVVFVLLVATANAGTLLLARSVRRRRELAIRDALGAGWRRLASLLVAESVILSVVAGALGVALAAWLLDGLVGLAPETLPRAEGIRLDGGVVAFALLVSVGAGLLTGALPALRSRRTAPAAELKEADGGWGARQGARTRRAFVMAEVALSVVLLVGAGLLGRSFLEIVNVDPGFEPRHVATFGFSLPEYRYEEEWQLRRYHGELLDAVRASGLVDGAAIVMNLPLTGTDMVSPALVEGVELADPPRVQIAAVSAEYFRVMGIRVVAGRSFNPVDDAEAPPVAMVNEAFVRAYLEGEEAVGRRARTYFGEPVMREIVGVVPTAAHASLTDAAQPKFYYPAAQMPPASGRLVVRSDASIEALAPVVRRAARGIDPEVPLGEIATLTRLLSRTTAGPRFYATTMGIFAGLALVLAVTGFFAVLSQAVSARRRELGVRLALGAQPARLLRMVLAEGLVLTGKGALLGLAGAVITARVLRGLLWGVGLADPVVLVGVTALLGAVALVAAWVPARRAAAVDPMSSLRPE
jgi:putative ABC transport system permease protein